MRLSAETADRLPSNCSRPEYDRDEQKTGIVHLGIGAFHRAHQAWYTDAAMAAGDRDWMIIGASLRSGDVAAQMNPQDGLFTLTERSEAGDQTCLIGSVREVIQAQRSPAGLAIQLITPTTHIVSLTVTEKGYCRAADGSLDIALADQHSIYAILADTFRERRASGIAGLTLLSCDNLASNGAQLHRLMCEYLDRHDPSLRAWFEAECTCPSTMVDRIVPATTRADRDELEGKLGLRDEAAVFAEPFSQWVIEDRFAGPRPRWEMAGAQFVDDVASYETAKLRMLNGAHSAIAYIGLRCRYAFVHQAIADPEISSLARKLMLEEAAPTIQAAPGQRLDVYADALLERFHNPAMNHQLIQIAMDGSQKIPQRWLETLVWNQTVGNSCPAICTALAHWIIHVRGDRFTVDDPKASVLATLWAAAGPTEIAAALFGSDGVFRDSWMATERDLAFLTALVVANARPA